MRRKAGKYIISKRESAMFGGDGGSIEGSLTGIGNISLTGTLSDGNYTFDTSGNVSGLGTVAGGAITSTGQFKSGYTLQDPAAAGATPGAISNSLTLAVNTYYQSIATVASMTIPTSAASNAGDFIVIYYNTAMNAVAHTYTTADTNYALGSTAVRIGGTSAGKGDVSTTNDDILLITGHAAGDGGVGTIVRFTNTTGAANGWAVEAVTTNNGAGSTAGTIAFDAA